MSEQQVTGLVGMILAALVGGAIGGGVTSRGVVAQTPDVVTAAQLNLVDGAGRLRVVLSGGGERGAPTMSLSDAAGQTRALFGLDEDGAPVIRLMDPTGQTRLSAMVREADTLLVVGDERARTVLVGSVQGAPIVSLGDGNRPRVRLELDAAGDPFLGMFDRATRRAAALSVDAADSPFLTLYEEGRARVTLGVTEGAALVNLSDPRRPRLVAGVADNGRPSVTLFGEGGEVVQEMPADR